MIYLRHIFLFSFLVWISASGTTAEAQITQISEEEVNTKKKHFNPSN